MKKILVTGGAGFIGSNLVKKLLFDENVEIVCIDNFDDFYSRSLKEKNIAPFINHDRFRLIEGDIRNSDDLEKAGDINVIVHLAAKAGVRPSILNPLEYQNVNVGGTQNLLEFAKIKNIKQFVFASSSSVYGVNENVPWTETETLMPISPYASTKLSAEMLGHVYSHLYNIRFIALRFFTVYGPGQRPDLAINKFFQHILSNKPIPVFGKGETSRDYTFVGDTVSGIEAAINYDKSNFEIINLGNYKTVTLNNLIKAVEDVCEAKAIINTLPDQPGDVPHTYADISKAKRLLNYNPQTDLHTGLSLFKNWLNNS